MHILVLNYEYPPLGGGASPVTHEINTGYVNSGHKVVVITMAYKDLPQSEVMDGVHVYRIKCLRSKKHMCHPWEQLHFLIMARKFLGKFLASHSFDVCHTHFLIPTGLLARYVYHKFNIPYIITSHGSDVPGHNPDRFTFLHRFTPGLIRKVIRDAGAIISPSHHLLGLIGKFARGHERKLKVIPNGIHTSKFYPREKKNSIVSAGRLLGFKGFKELVIAVRDIQSQFTLHILGDGPMMEPLKKLAKQSKMEIIFHGWVNNESEEYRKILGEAKIYSLVSSNENASIALLEGMASGCATITSDQTGCVEMVGEDGICIEPGKVEVLRQVLVDLIEDPDKLSDLGEKARSRVEAIYDWGRSHKKYESLLDKTRSKEAS